MKSKLILVVACVLLIQFVSAQSYGVKGGLNVANMSFSSNGMNYSPKSIIGIQFGPVADYQLKESLYLNTGLLYSLKGFKIKSQGETITNKFNYLEIPINVAYKFTLTETSKFFIQAGPYMAYALSAKGKKDDVSVDIDFKDDGVTRFDYGFGFGGGLEFNSFVTSLNYQLGFANIFNDDSYDSDIKVKNKVLQLSVAYMFGK